MLKFNTLPVGVIGTNCYLVYNDVTRVLAVIDPGGDAGRIAGAAKEFPAEHIHVLLTHAHVDHISGLGELAGLLKLDSVWCRAEDAELYSSPANALEPWLPAAKALPRLAGSPPEIDGMEILPIPGHTAGGAGFYFPAEKWLFSGDTLFAGSVGRTDLGGNWDELHKSITETLFPLPEDVQVHCGHGPSTTIGIEKKSNPYF